MLDFSKKLNVEGFTAYSVTDREEWVCVIPQHLQVFTGRDGTPAFRLEAIRGITPFSKPEPYGIFDIQLAPSEPPVEIVSQIRDHWPSADLTPPVFDKGLLGLSLIGEDGDSISGELEVPVQLSQLPLSKMRFIRRISIDYLNLLKESLRKNLFVLRAYGFFSVVGYTPKTEAIVNFNPAEITQNLLDQSGLSKERMTYTAFEEYFKKPFEDLPIELDAETEIDSSITAETLTDRYIQRFCTVNLPAATDEEVYFSIHEDGKSHGAFSWNLNNKFAVKRYTHFKFDAIEQARRVVQDRGIDQVVSTRIVESLKTGFLQLEIFHPFFLIPVGVRQIGIKIEVPANAPTRPQAIQKTVVFDAGQNFHSATIQFSPEEEQIYKVLPFVIYGDGSGTREILGNPFESSEQELAVEMNAYPLYMVSFNVSENLLSIASLRLTVRKKETTEPLFESIQLRSANPSTIIALPLEESSEFECHIEATSLTTGEIVSSMIPIRDDYKIDLTTFSEHGSHEVVLKMDLPDGKTVGIDLIPVHAESDLSKMTTIAFRENKTEIIWRWFSPSVFDAGFRYRFHQPADSKWSDNQSPFVGELTIETEPATI